MGHPRPKTLTGQEDKLKRARSKLVFLAIFASVAALALAAVACSSAEEEAPPAPTAVNISALIDQVMEAQQPGVTADDVAMAIQSALAAQPGITSSDVADEITKALIARPGVTSGDVASAIASALDERPGVTTQDVANEIARALSAQPGVTEDQVAAAIAGELAERPGITEDQVASIVQEAMEAQQSEIVAAVASTLNVSLDAPVAMDAGEAQYGGTLVTIEAGNLQAIDFHRVRSIGTMQWFVNTHLNILKVDTQTRDKVVGDAAESWVVSEDGTQWTFKIREGLTTHKGMTFDAEDVRYNIWRWLNQPNAEMLRSGCVRNTTIDVESPDAQTVVMTTGSEAGPAPAASFLNCISQAYLLLQPKGNMTPVDAEGAGRDLEVSEVDGIGPFIFDEYVPDNIIKSSKFEDYYEDDPDLPYLDGYNFLIIPDAAARIATFRTKQADFFPTFTTPRKPEADQLKEEYGDEITYVRVLAPGKRGLQINQNRQPFDDPEIRWAMHLAIDRFAVNALHHDGVGFLAAPYLGLWDWIYSFDDYYTWEGFRSFPEGRWDEDLAESKRILESKGFTEDNKLKVTILAGTIESDEITIGDNLDDSWIEISFDRVVGPVRLERTRRGDYDTHMESKGTEFNDPDAYNGLLYIPTAGINFTKWEDERWLKLNEVQKVELDQAQRGVYLKEMADIIFDAQIFVGAVRPRLNQINWSHMVGYVHPKFSHQSTYRWDHIWLNTEAGAPDR